MVAAASFGSPVDHPGSPAAHPGFSAGSEAAAAGSFVVAAAAVAAFAIVADVEAVVAVAVAASGVGVGDVVGTADAFAEQFVAPNQHLAAVATAAGSLGWRGDFVDHFAVAVGPVGFVGLAVASAAAVGVAAVDAWPCSDPSYSLVVRCYQLRTSLLDQCFQFVHLEEN